MCLFQHAQYEITLKIAFVGGKSCCSIFEVVLKARQNLSIGGLGGFAFEASKVQTAPAGGRARSADGGKVCRASAGRCWCGPLDSPPGRPHPVAATDLPVRSPSLAPGLTHSASRAGPAAALASGPLAVIRSSSGRGARTLARPPLPPPRDAPGGGRSLRGRGARLKVLLAHLAQWGALAFLSWVLFSQLCPFRP